MLITEQGMVTPQTDFTTGIGDTPKGEDFVFTNEDLARFQKYDLRVDDAISQGFTKEEIVGLSKEIEQEDLYKQQVSEQAPPGIQSIPVHPSTIPPASPPEDIGFISNETNAMDFAKLGGSAIADIVSSVAGFGLEAAGRYTENQTLYNIGKYLKERSHDIAGDLGGSISEGAKRDAQRFKVKTTPEGIPDITQEDPFGNPNLGSIGQLAVQALASMGPTLKLAKPIAKGIGKIPGVQAVEKATGVGVSGAGGLAGSAGIIEGLNSASDVHRDAMSATDEEIVKSPLYRSMSKLIAPMYPNSTAKELIDFTREQIANQASYEIGTKAGTLVSATSLPFGSFLGRMGILGGGNLGTQYRKGMTRAFWTGTTREGSQEFVQESGQQLLANYGAYLSGKSPDPISLKGVAESGVKAFVGGGMVGGGMGLYGNAGLPSEPVDVPPAPDTQEEAPTQEEASTQEETAREADKQKVYDEHIRAWEQANQRPYDQHVKGWQESTDSGFRTSIQDERIFPQDQQVRDFDTQFGQGDPQQDEQVKAYREDYQGKELEELPARSDRLRELQRKSDKEATGGMMIKQGSFDQQVKDYEQYADDPDDAPDQPNEDSDIPPFEEEVIGTTPAPPVVTTDQAVDPEFEKRQREATMFVRNNTVEQAVKLKKYKPKEVLALAERLGMDTSKLKSKKGKPKSGAKTAAVKYIFDWEKKNRVQSPLKAEAEKSKLEVGATRFKKGSRKRQPGWVEEEDSDLSDLTDEQLRERRLLKSKEGRRKLRASESKFERLFNSRNPTTGMFALFQDENLSEKFLKYLGLEGTVELDEQGDFAGYTPTKRGVKSDIPEKVGVQRITDSDLILRKKKKLIISWTKEFSKIAKARSDLQSRLDQAMQDDKNAVYIKMDRGEISEGEANQKVQQIEAGYLNEFREASKKYLDRSKKMQERFEATAKKYKIDISKLKPVMEGFASDLNTVASDTTFLNEEISNEVRDFTNEFKELFPELSLNEDGTFSEVGAKKSGDAKKRLEEFSVEQTFETDTTEGLPDTDKLSEMEQREQSEGFSRLTNLMSGDDSELGFGRHGDRPDQGAEFPRAEVAKMIRLGELLVKNSKRNKLDEKDIKVFREVIGLDPDGNVPLEKIKQLKEHERRKILRLFGELVQRERAMGNEVDIPKTPRGRAWLGAMLGGAEGFAKLPKPPSKGSKKRTNPFKLHWDEFSQEWIIDEAPDWARKANGETDEFGRTISDLVFDVSSGSWVAKPRWMMVEEGGRPKRDQVRYNEETGKYDPIEDQSPPTKITVPQLAKHYPMKLSISNAGSVQTIEIIVDDGTLDGQHIGTIEVASQDMEATDLTGWEVEKKTFKTGEIISANFNMAKNKYGISPRDINTIVANAVGTSVVKLADSGLDENFFNYRKSVRDGLVKIDKTYTNEGDVLLTRMYDQIAYIVENSDPNAPVVSDNKYDQHVSDYRRGEPENRMRLSGDKPTVIREGRVETGEITEADWLELEAKREGTLYTPYTQESDEEAQRIIDDYTVNVLMDDPASISNDLAKQEQAENYGKEDVAEPKSKSPDEEFTNQDEVDQIAEWEQKMAGAGIVPMDREGNLLASEEEMEYMDTEANIPDVPTALDANIDNTAEEETDLEEQCRVKGKGKRKGKDDDDIDDDMETLGVGGEW